MSKIIELDGLTKRFGELTAINDLSLSVQKGAIVGFIGPNGAGKTTTMRIITTLLEPTAGEVRVAGHSVRHDPRSVRRVIGYMPDFFGVYSDMKVWEYLDFFAACYQIPEPIRKGLLDDLLELVDLGHRRDDFVEDLSRGMKQRLCLARTLVHDPEVLILDEPASGLDPRARIEMRELLRELGSMGKTIFFSSHILSEIADVCTSVAILDRGNLVTYGRLDEIRNKIRPYRQIKVRVLGSVQELLEKIKQLDQVSGATDGPKNHEPDDEISFKFTGDDQMLSELLSQLVAEGFSITSFAEEPGDLEDVFMSVTAEVSG